MFYTLLPNAIQWRSCALLPDSASIEMSIEEADVFFEHTLPKMKNELSKEGCDLSAINYEFAKDGSGKGYIAAIAIGPVPKWQQRRSGF